MKIGSIVIDCNEFERMMAFWSEALHYVPRETPSDEWVVLKDPNGTNPNISLNHIQDKSTGKNRLHLDLYTNDQKGEVERLLNIGASLHPQEYDGSEDFIVLEDPDGNLFCIVQKN